MSRFTRRNFIAGAGCATAGAFLSRAPHAQAGTVSEPKRVLMLLCAGGWDISYSLDPKPGVPTVDSPEGDVQMFDDIPILVHESRPEIGGFFEAFGSMSAVVNGVDVSAISHDKCRARILTGNSSATTPDVGAIVGHQLGRDLAAPYLSLGPYSFSGDLGVSTTRVGRTSQINALIDPSAAYPVLPGSPYAHGGFQPDADEEALIRNFVESRTGSLQQERAALGFNADRVRDFIDSLGKGDQLRERVGDFGVLGEQLGLAEQAALAITALSDELAWSVSLGLGGFDTHDDNEPQGALQNSVFGGLRTVGEALQALPGSRAGNNLLDETLVLAFSEMSRTPRLNETGGKDHHPVTSALVFGGGVAGGRTYGGTNDYVESLPVDFETGDVDEAEGTTLSAASLLAGLVELAGGDASGYITNATAFNPMGG